MRALPGLFAVLLSIALAVPGRNDGQAGAREVIALARAALGGEATLEAVRSLSASGTFRRPLPFGELDLELSLPDRLKRTETMGLPGRPWFLLVSALDGDQAWMGPVATGPFPRDGMESASLTDLGEMWLREMRAERTRYLAALLLRTPSSEVCFSYVGEVEAPHGRSDVVDITAPDGFAARLFLDQTSHLPLMLTYAGLRPLFRAAEAPLEEAGIPETRLPASAGTPTLTLFLSDYREVDGIRLPHSLSRATNGEMVEEWKIDGWRVNPALEAASFRRTSEP
jgi:hypothetical protein